MNRIARHVQTLPEPAGSFTDADALELLIAYRSDPSSLRCPSRRCGPGTVEVLAFIHPAIDPNGYADVKQPVGEYAAVVYCHMCRRAIGIQAGVGES